MSSTDKALEALLQIRKDSKNNKHKHTWSRKLTPEQRLAQLNRQFKGLKLEDYLRTYTDLSQTINFKAPTEEQIQDVFHQMHKMTEAEQQINCSCCGYDTCREMATAIFNGFNNRNNCIHFIKNEVEQERENARALADENEREREQKTKQHERVMDTVTRVNEVSKISGRIQQLAAVTEEISASTDQILNSTEQVKYELNNLTE